MRRLAVLVLKNGSPQRDTIVLLEGLAADDEADAELRKAAAERRAAAEAQGSGQGASQRSWRRRERRISRPQDGQTRLLRRSSSALFCEAGA